MPEVCKAFGSTLIAEHDRLYGPGTGKAFVEGPYASDLPRALKARIRPALKRQAAQSTTVEETPEPAAAATDTAAQVTPSLPLSQSNPVEENGSGLGAKRPTEVAASAEHVALKRPDTVGEFAGLAESSTYAGKSARIVASIRTET